MNDTDDMMNDANDASEVNRRLLECSRELIDLINQLLAAREDRSLQTWLEEMTGTLAQIGKRMEAVSANLSDLPSVQDRLARLEDRQAAMAADISGIGRDLKQLIGLLNTPVD